MRKRKTTPAQAIVKAEPTFEDRLVDLQARREAGVGLAASAVRQLETVETEAATLEAAVLEEVSRLSRLSGAAANVGSSAGAVAFDVNRAVHES